MQFHVRPDDIGGHAKEVGGYTTRLSAAASAGETTLDSQAFGLINVFLASAATAIAGAAQRGVENSSKDMTETMRNLKQVVRQYDSDDDSAKSRVSKAAEK
ncbi:hypothetical protein N802_18115 [Knoellia sinensis KCTC 19936]|uniref:ESX-1 secretion-associated protein n=1 Tax=Knoellia sinensis KCTC 19936 TaxID=1385520 RepID=A0A0A0J664_9MICO|nr:hypothetical protein [Knoellia sinensis]KGN32279.1 hypothetical protein N802_18115 [Knoellia sinensis KCTC 19936]